MKGGGDRYRRTVNVAGHEGRRDRGGRSRELINACKAKKLHHPIVVAWDYKAGSGGDPLSAGTAITRFCPNCKQYQDV